MPSREKVEHVSLSVGSEHGGGGGGGSKHVLVMEFMRNSIVSNPIVVSGWALIRFNVFLKFSITFPEYEFRVSH